MNAQFVADTVAKLPVFNVLKSVGSTLVSILTNLMLITLFVIFIFMGKASSAEKPSLVGNIQKQISFYLLIKIFVSLLAAGFTLVVLASVKTELASMLAVLTFVLNFLPNIGRLFPPILPCRCCFCSTGLTGTSCWR
jgi:AI-2 transport protein TqsA